MPSISSVPSAAPAPEPTSNPPAGNHARWEAATCWLAAATMLALIAQLAGGLPFVGILDDVLSVGTAGLALVVLALVYNRLRAQEWSLVGLVVGISGMTLVLAGDALQHIVFHGPAGIDKGTLWTATFAIRDGIGNSLFYASIAIAGLLLLVQRRRWAGGLAIVNAALGYLDLAFASSLGLPPHTNFLLVVVWFIVLGASSWQRAASPSTESDRIAHHQVATASS